MPEKQGEIPPGGDVPPPPAIVVEQGQHALQAAAAAAGDPSSPTQQHEGHHTAHHHLSQHREPPIEEVPPPPYEAGSYGQLDISQNGIDTGARVGEDGRVEIKINEKSRRFTDLLAPVLRKQLEPPRGRHEPEIPEGLGYTDGLPPPPLNLVIQIVGSRGDVQPFVALGQVLKNKFNHRVRIATHPTFRDFVQENGLEFFSIGGDPAELMAFMVKNPGLMPGIESLRNGDIGKRRKSIYEIINGCWRSCIEAGDGTGIQASDDLLDSQSFDSAVSLGDPTSKPFVADAIIANPPSFAHVHIAEKLGIPLHLMFTMPWSPTQSFPHPLANIISSNTDPNFANFISYTLVDMLTWQGLGDIINRFREKALSLEPVSILWAPGMLARLKIPWTYCWSPALIPKPADWKSHIDISGFFFLNLSTNYSPPQDLADFLAAGPPPVYIGFGSIVVDDPNAMTKMIFEAVKKTGQRALVSKGWGGLGAEELGVPEGVFMLGNCPHDWLFKKVSCVVHHGGAGTTAAGIASGRPTLVVPFFGDQPFWGRMIAQAGAGPQPIPYKELTAENLANAISEALKPQSLERAKELSDRIKQENGIETGAESFHRHLKADDLRCSLCPGRVAVWRVRRTDIRLSALAATVLGNEGLIDFEDLKLYRPCDYTVDEGPPEPIVGGASAVIKSMSDFGVSMADFPAEILKSIKSGKEKTNSGQSTPVPESSQRSPSSSRPAGTVNDSESAASASRTSLEGLTSPSIDSGIQIPSDAVSQISVSTTTTSAENKTRSVEGQPSRSSTLAPTAPSYDRSSSTGSQRGASAVEASSTDKALSPTATTSDDQQKMTLESWVGATKASGKLFTVGLKSPMDFTMSLAQGFHNAPKLYGDKTVRKPARVTDFQSGLKAAGKEFGLGFYDGITGVVTQPMEGARKEGASGFMKGMVKGSLGLFFKPGASIWALPGYTFKGIYMEITKKFGKSVHNYIIAARTAQGYEDWKSSGPGERERIIAVWKSTELQTKRKDRKYGKDKEPDDEERRKVLKKKEKERKQKEKEIRKKEKKTSSKSHSQSSQSSSILPPPSLRTADDDEFEEAIQRSISQTSRGNAQEDAMIERAIRASVKTLRGAPAQSTDRDEAQIYERAVQAGVAEAQRPGARTGQRQGTGTSSASANRADSDEDELSAALSRSQENYPHQRRQDPWEQSDSGQDTEEDDDFKRAIEESKRAHTERQQTGTVNVNPPELPARGTGTDRSLFASTPQVHRHESGDDDDAELRQALAASMGSRNDTTAQNNDQQDDDEELRRAIMMSKDEDDRRQADIEKQKTEEEIVMEYVKKQSLLEEQHRQARMGKDS